MVGLTEKKKEKYRKAIELWCQSSMHDLLETQKLYGKLLHASHIVPAGRAYLTVFENFMGIFGDSPHMPRTPRKSILDDLNWWHRAFIKTYFGTSHSRASRSYRPPRLFRRELLSWNWPRRPRRLESLEVANLDGNLTLTEETLHGSRLLLSKSLCEASFPRYQNLLMSSFTATTKSLLKDGALDEVETNKSIVSSNAFIRSATTLNAPSIFDMSQDAITPPMDHPGVSIQKDRFSQSQYSPTTSLDTYRSLLRQNFEQNLSKMRNSKYLSKNSEKKVTSSRTIASSMKLASKFSNTIRSGKTNSSVEHPSHRQSRAPFSDKPSTKKQYFSQPYSITFNTCARTAEPKNVFVYGCLRHQGRSVIVPAKVCHSPPEMQLTITHTLAASWQPSTQATYGSGLLAFHVFCDKHNHCR